jgi:hypothetical protein
MKIENRRRAAFGPPSVFSLFASHFSLLTSKLQPFINP